MNFAKKKNFFFVSDAKKKKQKDEQKAAEVAAAKEQEEKKSVHSVRWRKRKRKWFHICLLKSLKDSEKLRWKRCF